MFIDYTLAMPRPASHLFDVTVTVAEAATPTAELVLPVWLPGWYIVRDMARHVQEFAAETLAGRPLPWFKVDKSRWRVENGGGGFRARYRVYANQLAVFASHLDDTHGFFNGTDVFMYLDGAKEQPCRLTIEPPPDHGWQVTIALDRDAENRFVAPNYDVLVDSPGEVGTHRLFTFEVDGVPHTIALYGHGNEDPARLTQDVARIVAQAREVVGVRPYPYYIFFLHLTDKGTGGMEHALCSVNHRSRFTFQPEREYEKLLSLLSHEFFHVWNVKRIRPTTFGPFDYTREIYTRLLWVMEGATSYYDDLILRRAGLIPPRRYLDLVSESIRELEGNPGRHLFSLTESSFDTWLKMYQSHENFLNSRVSFYLKGEIVHLLLDLEIRHRTDGARSLDDVLRRLWADYAQHGQGFPEAMYKPVVEAVAGSNFDDFWARYVDGTAELDFDTALAYAGLRLVRGYKCDRERDKDTYGLPGAERGHLGVLTRDDHERVVVQSILTGTPAATIGLAADDEIIALDGFRLTPATFQARLNERRAGETVTLTFFRRDELVQRPVTLAQRPPDDYRLEPLPDATDKQQALYHAWLGAPWEPPTKAQ